MSMTNLIFINKKTNQYDVEHNVPWEEDMIQGFISFMQNNGYKLSSINGMRPEEYFQPKLSTRKVA